MKKAIVLLSGGLDSTTILHYAIDKGFEAHSLIFDYGQRHKKEINRAKQIADLAKSSYHVVKISMPWLGSSLLDKSIDIPRQKVIDVNDIPSTYVPARNIIFLSFAASYAEAIEADTIFIGANAIDYSGYPDCRPEFFEAFKDVLKKGLKTGVNGHTLKIQAPLLRMSKAQIIKLGLKLKVPYDLTWSCYQGGRKPCGECDSCVLRKNGFEKVHENDPSLSH